MTDEYDEFDAPADRNHRSRRDRLQDEMPDWKQERNFRNKHRQFKSKPKGFKHRRQRGDKW